MSKRKLYTESIEQFQKLEGNTYGSPLWEMTNDHTNFLLQCRLRKSDSQPFIFQFWEGGKGYMVYMPESLLGE